VIGEILITAQTRPSPISRRLKKWPPRDCLPKAIAVTQPELPKVLLARPGRVGPAREA
jgi:hypothetical protein